MDTKTGIHHATECSSALKRNERDMEPGETDGVP